MLLHVPLLPVPLLPLLGPIWSYGRVGVYKKTHKTKTFRQGGSTSRSLMFRSVSALRAHGGPRKPQEWVRFEKQCRSHIKSDPETKSKAQSWAHCHLGRRYKVQGSLRSAQKNKVVCCSLSRASGAIVWWVRVRQSGPAKLNLHAHFAFFEPGGSHVRGWEVNPLVDMTPTSEWQPPVPRAGSGPLWACLSLKATGIHEKAKLRRRGGVQ